MSRLRISFRLVMFAIAGVFLAAGIHLTLFLLRPPSSVKEYREVLVPEGANFRTVAAELKDAGLITDKYTFILLGKYKGLTRKIRAGFYSFHTSMRPLEVLDILRKGKIIEYQVVLPEGYDINKVADTLAAQDLVTKKEFLAKVTDPAYVKSLGLDGETLEGYLYPATYFFPKGTTQDGMVRQMVSKYRSVFTDDLRARAQQIGMTERQAVTLASLIEHETGVDSERLLVSAVFHNRLKIGMPLQCDPCVIYALQRHGKFTGDLKRSDLRFKDPYNTYVYKGLPPGPIDNPGKPSITAALYPADVDYIYFVSKNDGSHMFSNSLSQHNRAVHKYQPVKTVDATGGEQAP